jgi:putative ABC transport system ATP-binding protein
LAPLTANLKRFQRQNNSRLAHGPIVFRKLIGVRPRLARSHPDQFPDFLPLPPAAFFTALSSFAPPRLCHKPLASGVETRRIITQIAGASFKLPPGVVTMTNPPSPAAVEATDLTRSLPLGQSLVPILNGVSLTIEPGEWVALTGPSGSGKSTLLGIIAGLDTPTSGRIVLDGLDITRLDESQLAAIRNQKVGVVFQSFNLIPSLTAQENVEVPLYVNPNRQRIRQRASEMLEFVGLGRRGGHQPHQLSGGEQQRVAIARALIAKPSLLVADEPTGNLDSQSGEQVLELFARLRAELHLTCVIATHDPAVAARADRRLHLVDGRLA